MKVTVTVPMCVSQRRGGVPRPPGRPPRGVPLKTKGKGGARVVDVDAVTVIPILAIGPVPPAIPVITLAPTLDTIIGNAITSTPRIPAIPVTTSLRDLSPTTSTHHAILVTVTHASIHSVPAAIVNASVPATRTLAVPVATAPIVAIPVIGMHRVVTRVISTTAALTTNMAVATSTPAMFNSICLCRCSCPGAVASFGVGPRRGARLVADGVVGSLASPLASFSGGGVIGGGILIAAASEVPCCVAAYAPAAIIHLLLRLPVAPPASP